MATSTMTGTANSVQRAACSVQRAACSDGIILQMRIIYNKGLRMNDHATPARKRQAENLVIPIQIKNNNNENHYYL